MIATKALSVIGEKAGVSFDGTSIRRSDLKKVGGVEIDSFILHNNLVDFERYIANVGMNL